MISEAEASGYKVDNNSTPKKEIYLIKKLKAAQDIFMGDEICEGNSKNSIFTFQVGVEQLYSNCIGIGLCIKGLLNKKAPKAFNVDNKSKAYFLLEKNLHFFNCKESNTSDSLNGSINGQGGIQNGDIIVMMYYLRARTLEFYILRKGNKIHARETSNVFSELVSSTGTGLHPFVFLSKRGDRVTFEKL